MEIKINSNSFFIFDLDDTLFREIDFLKSAYRFIAAQLPSSPDDILYNEMLGRYARRENVFQWITDQYKQPGSAVTMDWLLKIYREHVPVIELSNDTAEFLKRLQSLSVPAGLITDGRSITQRNKLKALGLDTYFSDVIISEEFGSEKPDERNYLYYQNKYPGKEFYFFGDNTKKDFIVPARLGWRTICIKDTGYHIHKQAFDKEPFPDCIISSFAEIKLS